MELKQPQPEPEKKKRGRKKKFNYVNVTTQLDHKVQFEENKNVIPPENKTKEISFGNINIIVHQNDEKPKPINLTKQNFISTCHISITKQELEDYNIGKTSVIYNNDSKFQSINKIKSHKILKHYTDSFSSGVEVEKTDILCFHCCHKFNNKPFFIPYDYCPKLNRYKLFGNFCSPNCAKKYAQDSPILNKKIYLISMFYSQYINTRFIKPAPPKMMLKCFGGPFTIEQFRENFDNNTSFITKPINTKVDFIEIIQK